MRPFMNRSKSSETDYVLSWSRSDIEQRFGFRGGKFTRTNNLLTFIVGVVLTVAFYVILAGLHQSSTLAFAPDGTEVAGRSPTQVFSDAFTERGLAPYAIALLFFWSVAILLIKWSKLRLQREALTAKIVPDDHDFVLSPSTVQSVIDNTYLAADNPSHFVLFNRVNIALSNLRNIGRIADVDDILRSQADHDESIVDTSYSLLRGFVWGIPILGFIGTVLGLSQAIGGFGAVLGNGADDMQQITSGLQVVTSGLSTAFETTLIALVAALIVQMTVVFQKKSEEDFLDACSEYCLRHVVSRLRVQPELKEEGCVSL